MCIYIISYLFGKFPTNSSLFWTQQHRRPSHDEMALKRATKAATATTPAAGWTFMNLGR